MAAVTFAEQMVAKYEALLLANAGATSVTVDGVAVAYADLEAKWERWKKRLAQERGDHATVSRIKMGGV